MNPHPMQLQRQLNFRDEHHIDRDQEVARFRGIFDATHQAAVLQIRAAKGLGKSWLLQKMAYESQKTNATSTLCYIDFHHPIGENNMQGVIDLILLMREELRAYCEFPQLDAALQPYIERSQRVSPQLLLALAEKLNKCLTPVNKTTRMQLGGLARTVDVDLAAITPADAIFFEEIMALVNHVADPGVAKLPQLLAAIPQSLAGNLKAKKVDWKTEFVQHKIPVTDYGNLSTWFNNQPPAELDVAYPICTTAFLSDLRTYQAQGRRVIFLFDHYDRLLGDAAKWMQNEFLRQLDQGNLPNVVVIVAGYMRLLDFEYANYAQVYNDVVDGLAPFTPEEARQFYTVRGIPPEIVEALIVTATYRGKAGHPEEMTSLMAGNAIIAKK